MVDLDTLARAEFAEGLTERLLADYTAALKPGETLNNGRLKGKIADAVSHTVWAVLNGKLTADDLKVGEDTDGE